MGGQSQNCICFANRRESCTISSKFCNEQSLILELWKFWELHENISSILKEQVSMYSRCLGATSRVSMHWALQVCNSNLARAWSTLLDLRELVLCDPPLSQSKKPSATTVLESQVGFNMLKLCTETEFTFSLLSGVNVC